MIRLFEYAGGSWSALVTKGKSVATRRLMVNTFTAFLHAFPCEFLIFSGYYHSCPKFTYSAKETVGMVDICSSCVRGNSNRYSTSLMFMEGEKYISTNVLLLSMTMLITYMYIYF